MSGLSPADIQRIVSEDFPGVIPKQTWGETSLFYNPGSKLPNGVYFCTLKETDGKNDRASALSRDGVFRLSIGITPNTYQDYFGTRPARPASGGIVNTGHDFTLTDTLMPHPIYAWMCWVCILSPSPEQFDDLFPLLAEAHAYAAEKFAKKLR